MTINMGPQHPSTHGVLRLLVTTDGEIVDHVEPVIGYLHRCKEKIAENLPYYQFMPYTDRLDYLAGMNNNWAWAMAVEKLAGVKVPERAEYIRVMFGELNRIASHLVAVGTFGLDLGTFTPVLYCFHEREKILDLFEATCGARLTYNYYRIGGVAKDLPDGLVTKIREFLDPFEKRIDELNTLLSENHIFVRRTANVGVFPPALALDYGVTGPSLRASGVPHDLRRAAPYSIYDRFKFEVVVGRGEKGTVGDTWDRYDCRVREMSESVKIVRQCLDGLPDGEVRTKLPAVFKPPKGHVLFKAENPKGELGYYVVSDGSPKPSRVHIRGPSFCNLSIIPAVCRGVMLADLVAILGSIDIVLGEVDR
ncbi:MAG: NADH-quinone oxidoreductase subunit D [Candidatus Riflebacteria bacterium]|nr:NADH-quinone oxidoreductase subunit D [Candidatus Riflebacteria bacterium]